MLFQSLSKLPATLTEYVKPLTPSSFCACSFGSSVPFVVSVSTPEESGLVLKKLIESGVIVTEMRQLNNPLQDMFDDDQHAAKTERGLNLI